MKTVINGGKIYNGREFISNDSITVAADLNCNNLSERVIDIGNSFILPALCDVHVHFREPGFEYKETIATGSRAAARGGYSVVMTMPNLIPAPHDIESLNTQLEIIKRDSVVKTIPYGAITADQSGRGALADLEAMAPHIVAFSDDGKGVQDGATMREAMQIAKHLGKIIVAHCEDERLLGEGKVRESEWRQIERDLNLAYETGAAYHVCHISCEESVKLIREAKKSGVDVTCETAPHYLLLDTRDVNRAISLDARSSMSLSAKNVGSALAGTKPEMSDAREALAGSKSKMIGAGETLIGGKFKMNPPIKDEADRLALLEGCADGTIDMIATDHAPHSREEKSKGFSGSANGIVGLECAFPVMYTGIVEQGILSFGRLMEMMSYAPKARFGINDAGSYVIMNLEDEYTIEPARFASMGRATPFDGWRVRGKTLMTIVDGRIVYDSMEDMNE